ncbi:carboxy-S-adenosyl-L-methionine synthase CmoA [Gilvimarinus agarilyticus]|uniref:carboxy-S-adenosyl-L-methionine synthase CmoA n=1 Tax=unclassified Gilvimarinus TaxID=2642066 RepID=UPI001C0919C7|nr:MULTISPECIES: carboxy-S-adenosyl-L-methionine synthase CmoA [unclassified Gilvimarinus]MBU2885114.1 carboxy-S-adenosyl-L-methionine synthase CmoA [Gilvimarinus agarilyticus]MDO6570012.1 carboxy-S-adenosyl-L-methionine synthase CmoA [Gilvimarinus sp. 2_MG-2023]MDO6747278.1 carboxy-S-adenosyl-L-methionine synthase CmoA [Gilvimarinus sp. 1_MG-2023]
MTDIRDTLYANPLAQVGSFSFDQQVVDVFPDMIKRSVPGYPTILSMIGTLAERYVTSDSHCYDLGCSLGAATLAMRHNIRAAGASIIGVDNSAAMIARARQIIAADSHEEVPVRLEECGIEDIAIDNASMVVLNFTLQFIAPNARDRLLSDIAQGLNTGGVLILSEKVAFDDLPHQQLMTDLHHQFKRANGYSDLEIAQKRAAIDNVLIPESLDAHRLRLRQAGFSSVDVWFQCLNFASIIAIK